MAYEIFGAIRIGSVEQELCIYEIGRSKGIRRIDRAVAVLPLGSDTVSNGRLSYDRADELCRVLNGFADVMKSYRADAYRAYATMALRDAENAAIVVDQIRMRTGLTVEIISNSEQRFINYKSLASQDSTFDEIIKKGTIIVDSGYGSMQLSFFDEGALVSTENVPLGAVRLLNYFRSMRFTDSQLREHVEEVTDVELGTMKKLYLKNKQVESLIALGDNIAHLFEVLGEKKLSGAAVPAQEAISICRKAASMRFSDLEKSFSGGREYARLILVTALVYGRLIEQLGAEKVYLPQTRFCDGVAAEYAEKQKLVKLSHNFENDIVAEIRNMAKRYRCNTEHAAAVEQYALAVFDATRKLTGLSKRDRLLLQIAAILHTCGKFVSIKNGSIAGYDIIRNTEMIGISHEERKLIAGIVLYHNGEYDYHEASGIGDPVRMAKLCALLGLANAMDRGHLGRLADVRIRADEKTRELVISTDFGGDLTLEHLSIEGQGSSFEELCGLHPVIRQKGRK